MLNAAKEVRIIKATKDNDLSSLIKVAAYCRVSTDSTDQLNSFSAQMRYYNDYIKANDGMKLVDIYADEGITGTEIAKRDEFKRLISDVKKKRIDRVLVKSVTRFARNSLECIETIRLFKSFGTSIYFENDRIDTEKMNSEMIVYIKSAFAQCEAESASRRMSVSNRIRMADGTYNLPNAPYGYRLENNELFVVPEEARNVKLIFEMYLNGMGSCLIAQHMQEIDKNDTWNDGHIDYIISNERYIGDCLLQKKYSTGSIPFGMQRNKGELPKYYYSSTHDAIIDKELFYRVQAIREERAKKFYKCNHSDKPKEFFHNKIYCRHCGWAYKSSMLKDGLYWVCAKQGLTKESCYSQRYADVAVRRAFIAMFNTLKEYSKEIVHDTISQLQYLKLKACGGSSEVTEIDEEILSLSEQNRVYTELYGLKILDEISYYEQTDKLRNRLTELRSRRLKILNDDEEENCLEELRKLEKFLMSENYITHFDETIFTEIVEKVFAEENGGLTFLLKCGLQLTIGQECI